jgi:hypothetical protein
LSAELAKLILVTFVNVWFAARAALLLEIIARSSMQNAIWTVHPKIGAVSREIVGGVMMPKAFRKQLREAMNGELNELAKEKRFKSSDIKFDFWPCARRLKKIE